MKKLKSGHGSHSCFFCKKKKAQWVTTIAFSNDMSSGNITVYLCDECARLTEDQLRVYFLR